MAFAVPPNLQLVYRKEQIQQRIAELAVDINEWTHIALDPRREQLLAVCVLRGGVFFFADLLRHLDQSVDPTFCRAESYSPDQLQAQGKGVQILGASPIVRALLLLIGISPRHFVKKAD